MCEVCVATSCLEKQVNTISLSHASYCSPLLTLSSFVRCFSPSFVTTLRGKGFNSIVNTFHILVFPNLHMLVISVIYSATRF